MNNLGNEIKKIRLERNIKAKDVYDGILSRAMYYRFENKGDSISYPILLKILQRLNIDYKMVEIFFSEENYQTIIENIYNLFFNNRIELNEYSKQLKVKFIHTGCVKYKHLAIISHNLYLEFFQNKFDYNEVKEFKKYIFGVECWQEYEIYLIINGIFMFSLDEIDSIYYRLIKTITRLNIPCDQVAVLMTGIISICYSKKDYTRFKKYINYLIESTEFLNNGINSMFSRTIIKFYSLLDDYINEYSYEIESQLSTILNFFLLVDMPHMFNVHNALVQFIKHIKH